MNNKNKDNKTIVMLLILLATLWVVMGVMQIKMGVFNKAAGYIALAMLACGAAFVYYHKK